MSLFPIAYFGSVRYFQDMIEQQHVQFEIHDHFPKQTYRNRMMILSSQGPQLLTLPVEKPLGSKTPTNEILISNQQNWRSQHWKAIKTAYASAPYFEHYASDIQELLLANNQKLIDLNESILRFFLKTWELPLQFEYTTTYQVANSSDFRMEDYEQKPMRGNYQQVLFHEKTFYPQCSILDLLFCQGPIGRSILV